MDQLHMYMMLYVEEWLLYILVGTHMNKLTLIALLILAVNFCPAQTFEVKNDKFKDVSTLVIKSFNGCCAKKGFRAKYYFNDKGHAIKSEHFFRRQKRAVYEYQYDSLGNLTYEIQTYSINHKERTDTNLTHYEYDSQMRIIKEIYWTSPEHSWTDIYSDFHKFNKPMNVISYSSTNRDTTTQVLEYNQKGLLTKIQYLENDSLKTSEILDYNTQGDLSYSLIPSVVGKENEPLVIWIGGNRHAPEERYEYTYDEQNRWIEIFVVYKDKKVLLETRKFK